ncbi:MAG: phosphocarrier protein HPr [Clostridiales bacterium]|nr:phosphocarrier protein HPr [Clostridiales bacterium]MDN5297666.1 phosphocarrier protein HPr [Clostridiales bacterium]
MTTKQYMIKFETGLHARPASELVSLTQNFESEISVRNIENDMRADGKSIIEILSLGAFQGTNLVFEATGPDEMNAVEAIVTLLDNIED